MIRIAAIAALTLASTQALAARDLAATITPPSPDANVYATGRYEITVTNVANQRTNPGTLTLDLPATNTSPTVHIMGTVIGTSSTCTVSGLAMTCPVPALKANKTASYWIDIQLPQADQALDLIATVSSPGDNNPTNDTDVWTASLDNDAWTISAPTTITNSHCTGTYLTSYFECTLYPSSISSHTVDLLPGGVLDFPWAPPGIYTGTWSQPSGEELVFDYYEYGAHIVSFHGYGTPGSCFEGMTTFPQNPSYVAPYHACF